jgi:type VI secretion system FHA domain protein
MRLTLRILTYRGQPVPSAPAVRFGAEGGSIGRSPENVLALDDPDKYISRVHARVFLRDGAFVLADLGGNPSVVNDRTLGKGSEVALAHGDRVLIGDYLLQAIVETGPLPPPVAPAPANDAKLPLFEPPTPAPPPRLRPLDPTTPAAPAPEPATAPRDALADISLLDIGPSGLAGGGDPLGLEMFAPGPANSARAAESDHVAPECEALSPGKPVSFAPARAAAPAKASFAIPDEYDPLADFFGAAPGTVPAPAAAPAAADPAAAPSPAAQPAADAVMAALLRGLGLPGIQLQRPPAEVAEIVGAMLREATAGTIDVLMARALTKKESRIDVTMLAARENNPLKFFPHAEGALRQLLTGSMPGYMAPVEAMAGAFDDLRAHELAVIAGMRAALAAVLGQFDPALIEARLALPTVMDMMLSSKRKAKLWDGLVELYAQIARDADDDLQRVYGEKFSEAYEEQVTRLRRARR